MDPIIESRFKKLTIRCPLCERPMGKRLGNHWWFSLGNSQQFAQTSMIMGQDTPYGQYKVGCPDKKCKGAHIFAWINETIVMKEKIAINSEVKN